MEKFNGKWTDEKTNDLILSHVGRTHAETAEHLSIKWNVKISRDSIKNKYNTVVPPKDRVQKIRENLITRDSLERSVNDSEKSGKRRYFVTSAIAGCSLNLKFLQSIRTYCKEKKAKLVVLPMRGVISKNEEFPEDMMKLIGEDIYTDYTFNKNIESFDIGMSPMQLNPLVGLARFAQKRTSIIIASPKQNMETVPVSNAGVPHLLHSTGAITQPSYPQTRTGMLADEDHVVGGLILEIADKQVFHLRQVQAGEDGSFYDIGTKYSPSGVSKAQAEAFVLGDMHFGVEDPTAIKAWEEVMDEARPKNIFMHDVFDGRSISHHEINNISARANRVGVQKYLQTELDYNAESLAKLSKKHPNTMYHVVRSNHDEHLDKYLDEARYVYDPFNYRLALTLAIYRCDGFNPLQKYIEGKVGVLKNINWLARDQDYKIAGIQMAAHGDKGANGGRGNIAGAERSYHKSITGHSHSPRILRNAWQVGTSTKLRLTYTQGPSSWLHASCLVYNNGQRQMIIAINAQWRT